MTEKEIEWYADTGDWHGAAGGYRIQGLASCFISSIEGTDSCVMGLPIFELYDILKRQGYSILE
jgi:septum formation protein